jgi:hypothetical protein
MIIQALSSVFVRELIAITAQPVNTSICAPNFASLSVTATGTTPAYQWYNGGSIILGATSSTYTTTVNGNYYVIVSNACSSVTSSVAMVSNNSPTVINSQPSSVVSCAGLSISFSVNASGTNVSYQWYKDGTAISGAISSVLSLNNIQSVDAGTYTATVIGACGTLTTNAATLTVNEALIITAQPTGSSICAPNFATLTVTATELHQFINGIKMGY